MKTIILKFSTLLFIVLLSSCNETNNKASTDKGMLKGTWTLNAIDGKKMENDAFIKQPKLQFDLSNNCASGNDGCNNFSGGIEKLENGALTFSTFAGTKMACPNMKMSDEINQALSKVKSFKIQENKLLLFDANDNEVLNYSQETKDMADNHTSENALDWFGTYTGTMPCADCSGIETELVLNEDKTYTLKTKYLGKTDKMFNENGTFNWNDKGNIITLNVDGKASKDHQYKVMENRVMKLNNEGNTITGDLKGKYVLFKNTVTPELKEGEHIYWVNSKRAECTGVGKMSCMQIQKGNSLKSDEWQLFYSKIKGFDFEAGYIYKLIVKEEKRPKNEVPADASSINYSLVKVLEKNIDKKMRLHDIWALQAVNDKEIDVKNYSKRPNLEINLTENRVMGHDGCNGFVGDIKTVDDSNLSFKPLAGTKKACPNMQFSDAIGKALSQVESYKIENLALMLYNAEGNEVLRYKKVD